jgi:ferric-chelate reductase (NADPH)
MSNVKKALLGIIGDKILQPAMVKSVMALSEHFRLIDLESKVFGTYVWRPGEKIQINTGDWNVRTYTPLSIEPAKSQLRFLAFIHGNGPGSHWVQNLKSGETCQFMGPRSSLKIPEDTKSVVFFGDETSFAAAATLQRSAGPIHSSRFVFEVNSVHESRSVCEGINLQENCTFIEKKSESGHLSEILKTLQGAIATLPGFQCVLTGNAKSIQYIREHLIKDKVPVRQMNVKAYWAQGKEGID